MSEILIPAWVDGELTPVEKLLAHQKGYRHKAISVFLMNKGRTLIQQRALSKYHTPGLWANTCCTHPMWDEADLACANRRLDEELGIKDVDPTYRGQVEYRADVGDGLIEHEVVEIFTAEVPDTLPMDLNPEEVEAVRWVDYSDLRQEVESTPNVFTPWIRIYLDKHANLIFGSVMENT
ncbi:isopentenyl-diphosphate Delta-isomerase [Cognatiyoonia sp.]|uniref:isopentenyl-diphosphate Delta-isomerase n=1 Tax=Cognatiyoonia sp. TaxID=2211652 RepID=UPI003F6A2307